MIDEEPSNGLEARWGNKTLRLFGLPTVIIVLISGALAMMVLDNRNAQARFQVEWEKAVEARRLQALKTSEEHRAIAEDFRRSLDEVVYVLTLNPEERAVVRRRLEIPARLK